MPEIKTVMTADISQFERAMGKARTSAKSASGGISGAFGGVTASFGKVIGVASKATFVIGAVTTAISALNGKNIDAARYSFERLATSMGVNADELIAKLRAVSNSMVDDFTLMSNASRALVNGLNEEQIVKLLESSAAAAKVNGATITKNFEDITMGIVKQESEILDNLFIIVKMEDAYKKFAGQLGVTVSALTDTQKRVAYNTAVMEAAEKQVKLLGAGTEGTFSETAKLITRVTNLWDAFGTIVQRVANVASGWVNSLLDQLSWVDKYLTKIGKVATEITGIDFSVTPVSTELTDQQKSLLTSKLNGNGVQAEADRKELSQKQIKEMEKIMAEIDKVIDSHGKTETEMIKQEYDKRVEDAHGNAELIKKIEIARNIELANLETERAENNKEFIDRQREQLLTDREAQLADLQTWYDQVAELEGLSNEQRIEASQIFADRKAQIEAEAREVELKEAQRVAKEKERLDKEVEQQKKDALQRQTDLIQSFGTTALQLGKSFGKENFEWQKGLSAGEAIMDTHAAVMKTMASVPYPFNIPLAAAQAAIGAAHVASILSATPEGGGSVGSATGGGGGAAGGGGTDIGDVTPTPADTAAEPRGTMTINIIGDIMNEDYVDLLAEKISDAVQDRNVILKASQARNVRG